MTYSSVPVEHIRMFILCATGNKADATYKKELVNKEGEKGRAVLPPEKHGKASSKPSVCGDHLYCTVVGDELSTTIQES